MSAGGQVIGAIGAGILAFIGIGAADEDRDADFLAEKLVNLRIFADDQGRMNRSALEVDAQLLLVSQFTLYGNCAKGRRPSFDAAATPARARELYDYAVRKIREKGLTTETGMFQAHMQVDLVNDGPVTFLLES